MLEFAWKTGLALTVAASFAVSKAQETPASDLSDAPSLMAQVKAASGGSAWDSIRALHFRGTAIHGGLSRTTEEWDDVATGRYLTRSASSLSSGAEGFDGVSTWITTRDGSSYLMGDEDSRLGAVDLSYRVARAFWYPDRLASTMQSLGEEHEGSRTFYIVSITPAAGRPFTIWIDQKTKLLDRFIEQEAEAVVVTRLLDYREVHGIKLPFRIEQGRASDKPEQYDIQTIGSVDFEMPTENTFSLPARPAADSSFPAGEHSCTIPFELTADNEIIVSVTVNGKGPFPAEFDSGGGFILGPSVAAQLSLKAQGTNQTYGGGEGSVTSGRAVVDSIGIGGIRLSQQHVRVFDVFPEEPNKMIVGSELLQRFVIRFDFDKMLMTITDPSYFAYSGSGIAIPFHFQSNQPEVYGAVDGMAGTFTIDTGDNGSLLLLAPFAKRYSLYERYRSTIPYGGSAVGGGTYGTMARAGIVALFGQDGRPALESLHPLASLSRQKSGYDANRYVSGNVGLALLKQFNLTFDYQHQQIFFEKNHLYGQPTPYNRTGLHVKVKGSGWIVISCDPGSPAAEANIKSGDSISTMNGFGSEYFTGPALYALFHQSAGTRLTLEMGLGVESRKVELILRDIL